MLAKTLCPLLWMGSISMFRRWRLPASSRLSPPSTLGLPDVDYLAATSRAERRILSGGLPIAVRPTAGRQGRTWQTCNGFYNVLRVARAEQPLWPLPELRDMET
jgi:hypothetical protein